MLLGNIYIYFSLNFEDLVKTLGTLRIMDLKLSFKQDMTLHLSGPILFQAFWCHCWWYVFLDPYHCAKPVVESFCTLGMDTFRFDSNEQEVSGHDAMSQINLGFVIWDDLGIGFLWQVE